MLLGDEELVMTEEDPVLLVFAVTKEDSILFGKEARDRTVKQSLSARSSSQHPTLDLDAKLKVNMIIL